MGIAGGYGGALDGHVVDFIHFYLQIGDTAVFPYIFNVADIAITTSIIILLLFHKWIMPEEENEESDLKAEADSSEEMGGASKIERADQQ
jgi:signal peptidase II